MDIIRNEKGEGYIDVCVLVLCVFLMLGLVVNVLPVYVAKNQLDTVAQELCREAEMAGRIGPETSRREAVLREKTGLTPEVEWSEDGPFQLNEEVEVTLTMQMDIGLFGGFGTYPVTLHAKAQGKGEVYWK